MKDPNRYWWLSLLVLAVCAAGLSGFERAMFPSNSGVIGGAVGFLLGAFLAALFEDFIDQRSE